MRKKSIRDMNYFERVRYSLSSKMFHTILLFSLIISAAAVAFGFFLYCGAVRTQYAMIANNIARTASAIYRYEECMHFASDVLDIYGSLDEATIAQKDEESYHDLFRHLETEEYLDVRSIVKQIHDRNDAYAVYLAAYDRKNDRLVYIIDSEVEDELSFPGYWDDVTAQETRNYFAESKPGLFGTDVPHVTEKTEKYGYLTTSWEIISFNERYIIMSMADLDMNRVVQNSERFLIYYILFLLILTVLLDLVIVRLVKKTVVQPITEINQAARAYITEKGQGYDHGTHFRDLKIQTGDEIESLALIIADMERDMERYVDHIAEAKAEEERISAELGIAAEIQEGSLPRKFPAFPDRNEFSLYATMHPAKEVGGDFYDFFLIDDDHLALVIADVSGKGIPAALFMMASRITIANTAELGTLDPGEILAKVNVRMTANNPAEMFVSVWLGILEISTGILRAANGGHEYPLVRSGSGRYEIYKDKHGLVLGAMNRTKYKSYEIQLMPGDSLFVYTDGVTEAADPQNVLFGMDRLTEAVNDDPARDPEQLCEHLKKSIDEFAAGAPQADDITMLALRYDGGTAMHEMTVEATIDNIPEVTAFVDSKLEELDCPLKAQTQIDIAIDELMSNIAKFAYRPDTGPATVKVEVEKNPLAVVITFIDNGKPYDPLKTQDPDITLTAEQRTVGGLGIYVVKKTMDAVDYEYRDGHNILRIKKELA